MYVIVGGYFMDELFETIFFKALKADSTDIHFKLTDHLSIQFRVFGELQPYQKYEKTIGAKIMNYLKYKSFINVNYKMVPQTGAFHYYLNEHIYFLRVSYLPGMDFESIVIRILNNHENITINEISEIDDFTFYLNEVCYQKAGLFLVAGATGSGKSTTLYAILDKIIEMGGRNVVTLEDPIEIVKDHCLQIEMNESMGIDYYNSLKQILRHDPDVIMIGEIRDEKTAKLAITCALTGHLVLSTIHASNSLLVIKRMLNLGINETDLEDVLIGVVTQRIKYDRKNRKVIILPETMNKNQIKTYFLDHTVSYPSFKDNALMLIKEKHCDQYLFKDELNGQ